MSTTSPPTLPPSCTPQSPTPPAARADDSLGSTVTRPYCSSNNNDSSLSEKNEPQLRQGDSNEDFNHGPRVSSSPSPPPSLTATTPIQTPQTSNHAADNDFFARNKLSKLDKLMCDDIAQSLLAAQGYERSSPSRYAWQGWCSYSVLLTQTKDGVRKSATDRKGSGRGRRREEEVPTTTTTDVDAKKKILLQFRPPHHAVAPHVLALARAVHGDELVPRLVYAADVLLWPRAVPPARELFAARTGGGREEAMAMDRLCVMATTLLPGVPYAVVQPGRSSGRRGRGRKGERGSGSRRRNVVVLSQEELGWQREVVRGFAGFVARGWTGCGAGAGADAGVVHGRESDSSSKQQQQQQQQQQQVSVSSLMEEEASGGGGSSSSLCDRIPAKLAQLCTRLPTLALRERAEGVRKKYVEMGLSDRCHGGGRPSSSSSSSSSLNNNNNATKPRDYARRTASDNHHSAPSIPVLPLTLNHGDLVPGNILVDRASGRLTGVVDWAEAEVGWWGLPLYGVEFLLGFVESRRSLSSSSSKTPGREEESDDGTPGVAWGAEAKGGGGGGGGSTSGTRAFEWTYYAQAEELRRLFWEEVEKQIGGSGGGFGEPEVRRAVEVVRDVGVLLWFGFAWDDGKVDRVVNEVDDPREVLLLETFLGVGAYGGMVEREKARL